MTSFREWLGHSASDFLVGFVGLIFFGFLVVFASENGLVSASDLTEIFVWFLIALMLASLGFIVRGFLRLNEKPESKELITEIRKLIEEIRRDRESRKKEEN